MSGRCIAMRRWTSTKSISVKSALAVPVGPALRFLLFDLFPINQFNLLRQGPHQAGSLDYLVAFAATVSWRVGPATQFNRPAPSSFNYESVMPRADQCATQAFIASEQFYPHHAFARAG